MYACMFVCLFVCMFVWVYVCMCVCMCVCNFFRMCVCILSLFFACVYVNKRSLIHTNLSQNTRNPPPVPRTHTGEVLPKGGGRLETKGNHALW